jgi:chemotaxis protein methyltransferase CheR
MSKPADWNITILATDFNRRVLRKAATGMYGAWSFRNPPPWLMKYFRRKDNHLFEIIPEIRRMVTFSYLNLVTDVYPPAMNDGQAIHVIFCRNVLMYLSPEHIKKIGQQFFASLCNDGWLITSGSELLPHLFSPLVPVNLRGTVLFRKPLTAAPPKKMVLELLQVNMPPTFISQAPIGFSKPHQGDQEQPVSPSKHVPVGTKDEERNAVFSLANQGRLSEAILLCESSLLRDKLNHYLHFLHAKILLEQNKEQEALSSLRRVIYLDPGFVLGHFTMGNLFRRQGNSRKAEKSYANVIDLLSTLRNDALLDESEGLTAGRLREIIQETSQPGYSP